MARTKAKQPIPWRNRDDVEGKRVMLDNCTTSSGGVSNLMAYSTIASPSTSDLYPTPTVTTTGTTISPLTQSRPQYITATITSPASTTLSSLAFSNNSTLADPSGTLALANSPTSTPIQSQTHDYLTPLIVVGCIAGAFLMAVTIVFIIRHLRKKWGVQIRRLPIFGHHIPQPSPIVCGPLYEQQPSFSEKFGRSAMGQYAQRDQQPPRVMEQLPRAQVMDADRIQGSSGHGEPPAYVLSL